MKGSTHHLMTVMCVVMLIPALFSALRFLALPFHVGVWNSRELPEQSNTTKYNLMQCYADSVFSVWSFSELRRHRSLYYT